MSRSPFDWAENRECVVIKRQDAVAVYANNDGDIVIIQERLEDNEDVTIIIDRKNARKVAAAIRAALKDSESGS